MKILSCKILNHWVQSDKINQLPILLLECTPYLVDHQLPSVKQQIKLKLLLYLPLKS